LRALAEPVTLFGEGPYDRRQRLRDLIASHQHSQSESLLSAVLAAQGQVGADEDDDEDQEFFTRGISLYSNLNNCFLP
jgi:U4/U6 small nuclear ribonucleoprotein PRP4